MTAMQELAEQLTAKAVETAVSGVKNLSAGGFATGALAAGQCRGYADAAVMTGETTEGEVAARIEAALYE